MPHVTDLFVTAHGAAFRLNSDTPFAFDGDLGLALATFLPGAQVSTTPRPTGLLTGRVTHLERDAPSVSAFGTDVVIHDRWHGKLGGDVPHLLHALALASWRKQGLFSMHAACLQLPCGDAVLLAGPSGSGKTSLALALLRAGAKQLSSNKTLLTLDKGHLVAVAGTRSTTLPADIAAAHADMMPDAQNWGGRVAAALPAHFQTEGPLPVAAVFLPRVDGAPFRVQTLSPLSALHGLLPLALDSANAVVALAGGAGVFHAPPTQQDLLALVAGLKGALHTTPVVALGGPIDALTAAVLTEGNPT